MRKVCICASLAVALVLTWNFQAHAQIKFPVEVQHGQVRDGSHTTADAFAKISRQPDKGFVEARLWLRKTSGFGKATAAVRYSLLDKAGNTLWVSPTLSRQIGADIRGERIENTEAKWDVPLNVLNNTHKVISVLSAKDEGILEGIGKGMEKHVNEAIEMVKGAAKDAVKELTKEGIKYSAKVLATGG